MPTTDDGAPELSIPYPDPIGRLYRQPGSEPLTRTKTGNLRLPSKDSLQTLLTEGTYAPSITNIIGVRNSPHLLGWAARKAAQLAVDTINTYPERIRQNPRGAVQYFSKAAERDRDDAADQGTLVHLACENYSRGIELPELTAYQRGYLNAYERFVRDFSPEFMHLEATVFGKTPEGLTYAGTTDFIAKINGLVVAGDIKTTRSGLHANLALQLSAVSHADTLVLDDGVTVIDMPKIDAAIGVHLSTNKYTVQPASIDGRMWSTFCALRQAWDFHVFDGHLADQDAVGEQITDVSQLVSNRT